MAKTTKPQGAAPAAKAPSKKKSGSKAGDTPKAKQAAAGPPRQPGVERRKNHPLRAKNGHIHVSAHPARAACRSAGRAGQRSTRLRANYLLPQGLATFATPHNLLIVEKHRQRLKKQEEARRADLQNLAAQIAQRSLTIEANANEEGHLYGSVNADQIAAALKSEGFPIETENVRIEGPLKDLGLYTIKVHLAQDIDTEVKLWVVPTHTDEAAPSA